MRIAFIALRGMSYSGGFETYTPKIAAELKKRGHEITVYMSNKYGDKPGDYQGIFNKITVPALMNKHLFRLTLIMNASFNQMTKKFDLVHYHLVETSFWGVLAKLTGKAVVAQSHGIDHTRAKWGRKTASIMRLLERLSCPVADELTVISRQVQRYYKQTYNKETTFIPPAIVIPEYQPPALITDKYGLQGKDYYLFMARIVPEKGAHYLIEAFKKTTTEKKLIIAGDVSAGDKYTRSLYKLAEGDKRIIFVGNISGQIKAEFLGNAFAFVLPSEMEGLCAALLEAMSYKTCCLVSDIPENNDVADGISFFFKNRDIDDCARVMAEMEQQPEKMQEYIELAFENITKNYLVDQVVDQLEALYYSAIDKRNRRSKR